LGATELYSLPSYFTQATTTSIFW